MASPRSSFIVRVARDSDARRIRVVIPSGATWEGFLCLLRSRFQLGDQDAIDLQDNRGSQVVCLDDVLDDDELVIKTGTIGESGRGPTSDVVLWAALSAARLSDFRLDCKEPVKRDRMSVTATLPSVASSRLFKMTFVGGNLMYLIEQPVSSTSGQFDDFSIRNEVAKALLLTQIPKHPNVLRWWTKFDVDETVYDTLPGRMMYQLKDSLLPLVQTHGTASVLVFDHHTLSLKKMLDELPKPLALQTVLELLLDINSVLLALTQRCLVLRNIDVCHMQISSSGVVVLSDFSTICGVDELTTTSVSSLDSLLTPPEIMDNALGSDRSVVVNPELCHVWSLGMVGCCIITGVSASSVAECHEEILNPLIETYPVTVIQLLKSCISVDPTVRPSLAVVRATLQGLQNGHLPADGAECQQTVIAPGEVPCQLETTSEALPQTGPEQTNAREPNELDGEATRRAITSADGFGLMMFPVGDSTSQPESRNNRTTGNEEIYEICALNGKDSNVRDAPPSYAEVCGNAEARPLDSASSSDDELTHDSPPPRPSTRPTHPREASRQLWCRPRPRPWSAVVLRDPPEGDEADRDHEQDTEHIERDEETIPLHIADSDEYIPMPLFSDVGTNNLVHIDYTAVDLDTFCSVTSASRPLAQYYLGLCGGVLGDAIALYMETSGRQSQPSTRPQRWSAGENRTILGQPRLRTEASQDNTSSHNVHQLQRRPLRTELPPRSHRQSWAGPTQPISPLRGPQPVRRRVSEGGSGSNSTRRQSQPSTPHGWSCPHSREPRECLTCAMFSAGGNQSRSRPRGLSHQGSNQQRKQSSNCKLS